MSIGQIALAVLVFPQAAFGGVFAYEATALPDSGGWTIGQIYCDPQLWIGEGWFFQHVELCPGDDPPGGQQASYYRALDEFIGIPTFFAQWRIETDADQSENPWGGGASVAASSFGGVNYKCDMTRDLVELWRDNSLPIINVPIEPGVPHTYRLELFGTDLYAWYIDGQVVDSGVPEGPYPIYDPRIAFRAKAAWLPNTTKWDYIRYGTIPAYASGDFDSDGDVDATDLYFFLECLLAPDYDAAGPGCRWADINADGAANGADIAFFAQAMIGP